MILPEQMKKWGRRCLGIMGVLCAVFIMGMIGMPDGGYSWGELPALAQYSLIGAGIFCAAGVMLLAGTLFTRTSADPPDWTKGIPAQGKIIKISDTGTTVNFDPVVKLLLEIYPADQPPFQAETEHRIPRLRVPRIQPGAIVQVKYDPDSKAVVLVDEDGLPLPSD